MALLDARSVSLSYIKNAQVARDLPGPLCDPLRKLTGKVPIGSPNLYAVTQLVVGPEAVGSHHVAICPLQIQA